MTRARFLPEAENELAEAVQFYERAEVGLGAAFTLEVERTVERIGAFPDAGSKFSASTRGKITANFPFWVIYRTDAAKSRSSQSPISVANRAIGGRGKMRPANNTLERAVSHRGCIVLARDCVLADAQWRRWPAAQLGR